MSKFRCTICNYVYDEEIEGKKFSDLPKEWVCPVCGVSVSDFVILKDKISEPVKKIKNKNSFRSYYRSNYRMGCKICLWSTWNFNSWNRWCCSEKWQNKIYPGKTWRSCSFHGFSIWKTHGKYCRMFKCFRTWSYQFSYWTLWCSIR